MCFLQIHVLGVAVSDNYLGKAVDYILGVSGHSLMYLIKNSKEVYGQEICLTLLNTAYSKLSLCNF